MAVKKVQARHGVVCDMRHERFGYFGWPSVARMEDGTMVAGASGLRHSHVCPWGKTTLFFSKDDGQTWSFPKVINDSPLDDRDCGVVSLGGTRLLATWFTLDIRNHYRQWMINHLDDAEKRRWETIFDSYTDPMLDRYIGAWARFSYDGHHWSDFIRTPVNTPHGPIRLQNGNLLYFGKQWQQQGQESTGAIMAALSTNDGFDWQILGTIPIPSDTQNTSFHEPHVVEIAPDRLLGLIRFERPLPNTPYVNFSLFQTESIDGGKTWSTARHLGVMGSPPHVIKHASGALVCVYGWRHESNFGQRAMISHDNGQTWDSDWIIRSDGPTSDLGYPCSVEMPDGSLFTVYYQQPESANDKCAILWSRWQLPKV